MLSALKTISCISLGFVLVACAVENDVLDDPNGKAEIHLDAGIDLIAPEGENDDPCDAEETWRCVYSERFGDTVSQVCRSCANMSVDDAKNWQVCKETVEESRWVNFNLSPESCDDCSGSYSHDCRAPAELECNSASCAGCCDSTGTCMVGVEVDMCGFNGSQCVECAVGVEDCYGGWCRQINEMECGANGNCAEGQICYDAKCIDPECASDEDCFNNRVCLNGICIAL